MRSEGPGPLCYGRQIHHRVAPACKKWGIVCDQSRKKADGGGYQTPMAKTRRHPALCAPKGLGPCATAGRLSPCHVSLVKGWDIAFGKSRKKTGGGAWPPPWHNPEETPQCAPQRGVPFSREPWRSYVGATAARFITVSRPPCKGMGYCVWQVKEKDGRRGYAPVPATCPMRVTFAAYPHLA